MMIRNILLLLLILIPSKQFCQAIYGKIENNNGEKIPFANVVIKDSINSENIKEYVIAKNGFYSLTLKEAYQKVVIQVLANGYYKSHFTIDSVSSSKSYIYNFILLKDSVV